MLIISTVDAIAIVIPTVLYIIDYDMTQCQRRHVGSKTLKSKVCTTQTLTFTSHSLEECRLGAHLHCASEVTTLWRYTNVFIILIIIISEPVSPRVDKPLKSLTHGQCDARPTVTSPAAGHHCRLTGTR